MNPYITRLLHRVFHRKATCFKCYPVENFISYLHSMRVVVKK